MAIERNPSIGTPEFTSAAAGAKRYGAGRMATATTGAYLRMGTTNGSVNGRPASEPSRIGWSAGPPP